MKRFLGIMLSIIMIFTSASTCFAISGNLIFTNVSYTSTANSVTATVSVKKPSDSVASDASLLLCQYGSDGQMINFNYETISDISQSYTPISVTLTGIDPAFGSIKAYTADSLASLKSYRAAAVKGTDSVSLKYIKVNGKKIPDYSDNTNKYAVEGPLTTNVVEVLAADNTTEVETLQSYDSLSGIITVNVTGGGGSFRQIIISVYKNSDDVKELLDLEFFIGGDKASFTFNKENRTYNVALPDNSFYVRPKVRVLATSEVEISVKDKDLSSKTYGENNVSYMAGVRGDLLNSYIMERPCRDGLIPIKNEETTGYITVKGGGEETKYTFNFTSKQPRLTEFALSQGAEDMWKPWFVGGAAINDDRGTILEMVDSNPSDNVYLPMEVSDTLIGASLFAATCNNFSNNTWWTSHEGDNWFEFTADTPGTAYMLTEDIGSVAPSKYLAAGWSTTNSLKNEYYVKVAYGVKDETKNTLSWDEWTGTKRTNRTTIAYKIDFAKGEKVKVPNLGMASTARNIPVVVAVVWDKVPVDYQINPDSYKFLGMDYEYYSPTEGRVVSEAMTGFKQYDTVQDAVVLPDDVFYVRLKPVIDNTASITAIKVQDSLLMEEENIAPGNELKGKPYGASDGTAFYLPEADRVYWSGSETRPREAYSYPRELVNNILPIKNGESKALITMSDGSGEKTYSFTFNSKQPMLNDFDLEMYSDGGTEKSKYSAWFTGGAAVNTDLGSVTGTDTREYVLSALSDGLPIIGGSLFAASGYVDKSADQQGKILSFTANRGGRIYLLSTTNNSANFTVWNQNLDTDKQWKAENWAELPKCYYWDNNELRVSDTNYTPHQAKKPMACGGVASRKFSAGESVEIYSYEAATHHVLIPIIVWDGVNALTQYNELLKN